MNAKQILALGAVLVALAGLLVAYKVMVKAAAVPESIIHSLFADKVTIHVQNDIMGVKPIGELALAKIRTRSIVDYVTAYLGSSKHIIAHQAFDVKIGWDVHSDISIVTNPEARTAHITASRPHLLSLTHVEKTPVLLLREDGVINKLTPEDMMEVQRQLENNAKVSEDLKSGCDMAMEQFQRYFTALFQMQKYTVTFEFKDGTRLDSPLLNSPVEIQTK